MNGLLQRNIVRPEEPVLRAQRNRLVATFSPLPKDGFPKLIEAVQPLFQQAGFAPHILVRPSLDVVRFDEVSINYAGTCEGFALAHQLYTSGENRNHGDTSIDVFISLCGQVAEAFDALKRPKGWFNLRRTSTEQMQPTMPAFDKTQEQAAKLARRYASFIKNLPRYQRSVELIITGTEATPDELLDSLEFIGLPPKPVDVGAWYDEETCTALVVAGGTARFVLPCVPRTPSPEAVFENLRDAARHFTLEFGGRLAVNDTADRVIAGWEAVLAQIGFYPGDDEVREFFPYTP